MAKKIFICNCCGNSYFSNKRNSKYCSLECKNTDHRYKYNCDYCGKEITIYKNDYEKLQSGVKKHKYCSKECANNGLITRIDNICLNCGNSFYTFESTKENNKYCCKQCYNEYRQKNAEKNIKRICPICNQEFYSDKKNSKYCSYACSAISQQNRIKCKCDYCGTEFERIVSEVNKNEKHYCSTICKKLDQKWNSKDIGILYEYYRKIPIKNIVPMLSKPYSVKAIRSEAGRQGLCTSRLWTNEEIEKLKRLYPTVSMQEVLAAFNNSKTMPSILGKARTLGLKSWFYNKHIYSSEEDNYLRNNYLEKSNDELAKTLNRTLGAIGQRLIHLGLKRPFDPKAVCYQNVASYIRGQNAAWRNHIFFENNYTCYLTNKQRDVVIHHCYGFNLLLQEAIDILDFEIKDNFDEYDTDELEKLYDCFFDLQDSYGQYVCINKDIHVLFHNKYGYGNNTMEQWNEFEADFLNGKYKEIA